MVYIFSTLFAMTKKHRLKSPNQVTLLWSRPKRPAEHERFGGGLAGDETWMGIQPTEVGMQPTKF